MKYRLSTPVLTAILVFSSGLLFPLIFGLTDRLLRELFSQLDPTLLVIASFSWLLLFYFLGIKFSLEYLCGQFEILEREKLFRYSNIAYTAVTLLFYSSLVSASAFSNLAWGGFYLVTIGVFYLLSGRLLKEL